MALFVCIGSSQLVENVTYDGFSNPIACLQSGSRRAINLREHLRTETRDWHERVEKSFDAFDLASPDGAGKMVDAHVSAMEHLLPHLQQSPALHDETERLLLLSGRSNCEGTGRARDRDHERVAIHPLAIGYVILGSRLGARVISKRIDDGNVKVPAAAYAFLSDTNSSASWQRLRDDLDAVISNEEREEICRDAKRVFAIYHDAALALQTCETKGQA